MGRILSEGTLLNRVEIMDDSCITSLLSAGLGHVTEEKDIINISQQT